MPKDTCVTTCVVHLELVHDMSTDAFLLALRRFIYRRGFVKVLRLDNCSNFIGAEKKLKEALRQSLVKLVKRALRVIAQDREFTEDSLTTFICKVESVITQRSLTPTSENIDNFDVIGPYHFLLGSPLPNLARETLIKQI